MQLFAVNARQVRGVSKFELAASAPLDRAERRLDRGRTDERAAFVSDHEQRDEGQAEREKHRQLQDQRRRDETLLERPWPELPHHPHHVCWTGYAVRLMLVLTRQKPMPVKPCGDVVNRRLHGHYADRRGRCERV